MSAPNQPLAAKKWNKADFESDQTVRWCPGCGDYSILANVQRTLADLQLEPHNTVFISGIGCSSRFPYYMNTYGFHTIHGRAPSLATGLKLMRPELSIWVITGDGDGLSIGGNHMIHTLRRNLDINILLFNNRIYGLTKGQYSPTSEQGKITKSTASGSIDNPVNPIRLALASEATFVARTMDVDPKGMQEVLKAAYTHKGASFVEIYQNCNIFNDGAYAPISERSVREDRLLRLQHGKQMIFGKHQDKGLRFNGTTLDVVYLDEHTDASVLITHDMYRQDSSLAYLLSNINHPEFPVPMGVFRSVEKPTYEDMLNQQVVSSTRKKGKGNLKDLIYSGEIWEVKAENVDNKIPGSDVESFHHEKFPEDPQGKADIPGVHHNLMNDKVRDLKPPQALIVSPESSVAEAIRMMHEKDYGCVLVEENDELLGIFTEWDVFMKVVGKDINPETTPVSELMIKNVICVDMDHSIAYAFNQLAVKGFHHLAVTEKGKPVGFISARGLMAYITGLLF